MTSASQETAAKTAAKASGAPQAQRRAAPRPKAPAKSARRAPWTSRLAEAFAALFRGQQSPRRGQEAAQSAPKAPSKSELEAAEAAAREAKREFLYGLTHGQDHRLFDHELAAAIEAGFDINMPSPVGQRLIHSTAAGREDMCRSLIARGAKLDLADKFGLRPLHHAAKNHPKCCVALLDGGAKPNGLSKDGQTPLTLAIERSYPEAVAGLLRLGPHQARQGREAPRADPNRARGDGSFPVHVATARAREGAGLRSLEMLLEAQADPNVADAKGRTGLHLAARAGATEAVDRLLDAGADPSARDDRGQTAAEGAQTAGSLARDSVAACISRLRRAEAEKAREALESQRAAQEAEKREQERAKGPAAELLSGRFGQRSAFNFNHKRGY